jgi:hypothetical protein
MRFLTSLRTIFPAVARLIATSDVQALTQATSTAPVPPTVQGAPGGESRMRNPTSFYTKRRVGGRDAKRQEKMQRRHARVGLLAH